MVGKVTGEMIKSAVALKIRADFAYDTKETPPTTIYPIIYKEKIVYNMETPAFFVWIMDVKQEKGMTNNYKRIYQINVRYHPKEEDLTTYESLADIANKLFNTLSNIEVPINLNRQDEQGNPIEDTKPVRGDEMDFTIQDGILQFFVTYVIYMKKYINRDPEQMDKMRILNIINDLEEE